MHTQESIQKAVDEIKEVCKKHGIVLLSDEYIGIHPAKQDATRLNMNNVEGLNEITNYGWSLFQIKGIGEFI